MKTLFPILFLTFIHVNLSAQSCLPAGITITAQSQIDQFPSNNPGCKIIGGTVYILGAGIKNIDSLIQLERISGDLLITGNDSLEHLLGLSTLQSVGQAMRIQNKPRLESLDGLEKLTTVEGDFFYVGNNSHLRDIQGLEGLDSVAGIFQVWGHDSITSLHGLEQLRWVGNTLAIFENVSLASLDGLDGLEYVGNDLRIEENPLLHDIAALNHAVDLNGPLVITDNPMLGDCAVQAICQYLAAPASFVAITGNSTGCESTEVVEAACVSATDDLSKLADIRIFPNPTPGHLTVLPEGLQYEMIRIRDVAGKTVRTEIQSARALDLSALDAGFYWVDIIAEQWRRTLPVVKK